MEWRFFGQDHARRFQDFIDAHLGFGLMLNDYNHAVSGDGGVDLDANCVLSLTPKPLDIEVLLHPFEEQLDLPSAFVKVRNLQSIKA